MVVLGDAQVVLGSEEKALVAGKLEDGLLCLGIEIEVGIDGCNETAKVSPTSKAGHAQDELPDRSILVDRFE
jgi:hypothetical protein